MDKKELLKQLRKLQKSVDTESAHSTADELLLKFINDKDISKEFNKVNKWYA